MGCNLGRNQVASGQDRSFSSDGQLRRSVSLLGQRSSTYLNSQCGTVFTATWLVVCLHLNCSRAGELCPILYRNDPNHWLDTLATVDSERWLTILE